MFNPVIIFAIIIQAIVRKVSAVAGAIFGFLITTGILIWGLSVYKEGNYIALFGAPLNEHIFLYAIIFWYIIDTREFIKARKQTEKLEGDTKIEKLPLNMNCPKCDEELELTEQERTEKIFTCPECNRVIDLRTENTQQQVDELNTLPEGVDASNDNASNMIECPECGFRFIVGDNFDLRFKFINQPP